MIIQKEDLTYMLKFGIVIDQNLLIIIVSNKGEYNEIPDDLFSERGQCFFRGMWRTRTNRTFCQSRFGGSQRAAKKQQG